MKKEYFIYVGILLYLFSFIYVNALSIDLVGISIKEKSSTMSVTEPMIENNDIKTEMVFNNINDYVIFHLTLKNTNDVKSKINRVIDNNTSNALLIEYTYDNNYTMVNGNFDVDIKLSYKEEPSNSNIIVSFDDLKIDFEFVDENNHVITNPKTGDSIFDYCALLVLTFLAIVATIRVIKKENVTLFVIVFLVAIPYVIKASSNNLFQISFNNIRAITLQNGENFITKKKIYPIPQSALFSPVNSETYNILTIKLNGIAKEYQDYFEKYGFVIGNSGMVVNMQFDASLHNEEYHLIVDNNQIEIVYSSERGAFYAITSLSQMVQNERVPRAIISDEPEMEYRGVVEGFYGTIWTDEYRKDLLNFMGKYKLNTFIYAPKNELKHRDEWRELYNEDELNAFEELLEVSLENNVDFVYAISPGVDYDFENYDSEFLALTNKCEGLYSIGIRSFALFLDDITSRSYIDHARLLNDFQEHFIATHDDVNPLIAILPVYNQQSSNSSSYMSNIGPLIDSNIVMMWTGNKVIPATINAEDLNTVNTTLDRKTLIWWNYPVNDFNRKQIFLGPCEGLDENLGTTTLGLLSNPMNQGYASLISLFTTADYLWNPHQYNMDSSLEAAIKEMEPENIDGLRYLIDLNRGSKINNGASSFYIKDDIVRYNNGDRTTSTLNNLVSRLETMYIELVKLRDTGNAKLLGDVELWLTKSIAYSKIAEYFFRAEIAKLNDNTDIIKECYNEIVALYYNIYNNNKEISLDALDPIVENALPLLAEYISGYRVYSNLLAYQTNYLTNLIDGNPDSYFWASGAIHADDYVTLDLGSVQAVNNIMLKMTKSSSKNDYIKNGLLQYSTDNNEWQTISEVNQKEIIIDTNIEARYIRIIASADQSNWLVITDFSINN